jgi:protein-S-isoprenylcysteine O-methyltransferase Ste14
VKRSALLVTVVPIIAIAFILYTFAQPPWTRVRFIGLALALFGFIMLTIARVQLGNAFSVTPQATMLVTHGIYRRIRHPVYVFSAVAIAGLLLYINRPELLLVLLVLIPIQVVRARQEQRVLEERFGEQYRVYKRSTWF